MKLKRSAVAGTLESSDAQVVIEPADKLELIIQSSVIAQYGREIRASVEEVLSTLGVEQAKVTVRDQGALDCTLRSRVQTAVFRALDQSEDLPWRTKL